MKKYIYRVEFQIKAKRDEGVYAIDIEADTKKEAREITESMWYSNHTSHMFGISLRRLKAHETIDYNYFKKFF